MLIWSLHSTYLCEGHGGISKQDGADAISQWIPLAPRKAATVLSFLVLLYNGCCTVRAGAALIATA